MTGKPLTTALSALRDDTPVELHPVIDALIEGGEDEAEKVWHTVLEETLSED
jgi:hypothetical protein